MALPRPATTLGAPQVAETLGTATTEDEARAVTQEDPDRYVMASNAELGRGGIGRVVLAFDEHLGREVALKELLPPQELSSIAVTPGRTSAASTRFLREARLTAQLEHPNIVPVYEVGQRADGTLYYTMKRVRGRTLADALDQCHTLSQRMHLLGHFVDMCQAMAYAHSRGVIHRDLKPQNVMVGQFGETVVLDWGLAKAHGKTDIRSNELARGLKLLTQPGSAATLDGSTLGTPAYMSPEQAAGDIDAIDERSDVWSLGTVLFELLTGQPPFDGTTPYEVVNKVLRDKPPRVLAVAPDAPPDLAAVADKALQRDKQERYQTAGELADDVEAFLTGQQVSAHRYSSAQMVTRFMERNRRALAAVLTAGVLVLAGAVHQQVSLQRDSAQQSEQHALEDARKQATSALSARAALAWSTGDALATRLLAASALALDERAETRGLLLAATGQASPVLAWQNRVIHRCVSLAWSVDGSVLACGADGGVVLFDGVTGRERRRIAKSAGTATSLVFAAEHTLLMGTAAGARLWNVEADHSVDLAQDGAQAARSVVVSGNQAVMAMLGDNGALTVWTLASRTPHLKLVRPEVESLALSADGGTLLLGTHTGVVELLDVKVGGRAQRPRHTSPVRAVALSTSGESASGDLQGDIHLGNAHVIHAHRGAVTSLGFSANGNILASASVDGTTALWDVARGTLISRIGGHDAEVAAMAFSTVGRLAADSGGKMVRVWQAPPTRDEGNTPALVYGRLMPQARANLVLHLSDLRVVAATSTTTVASSGGSIVVDSAETRNIKAEGVVGLALSRNDQWLLVGSTTLQLRSMSAPDEPVFTDTSMPARLLVISDDGSRFAAQGERGPLRIYTRVGQQVTTHNGTLTCDALAIHGAGTHVACGDADGSVQMLDAANGTPLWRAAAHQRAVRTLAFSTDGALLASGGRDQAVRIWDVRTGGLLAVVEEHHAPLVDVMFAGAVLFSAAEDHQVLQWDTAVLTLLASELVASARRDSGLLVTQARLVPDPAWQP